MSAADEARAEAQRRVALPRDEGGIATYWERDAFIMGAEWQASRDATEYDLGADEVAMRDMRAEVAALTAQLRAAQATIAEALRGLETYPDRSYAATILSRADTSTHDAAILAAKAEGWQHCISKFASYGHIVKGVALDWAESENPYIDDPYRASIEQTEANRG